MGVEGGQKTLRVCTFPERRRGSRLRNLLVILAGVGLNGSEKRRRIIGTGRSINQQIFIEQLPWLAAGASSAGGRHIRKLSIKRWLWGRGRDVFFWNSMEQARLLCCLAREGGVIPMQPL